jgi:hypothetical protein
MSKQQLRRACLEALMDHFTRRESYRPMAIGGMLVRSDLTLNDLGIVWAKLGEGLRDGTVKALPPPERGAWDPLRDLLVEYHAVMRERPHPGSRLDRSDARSSRAARRRPGGRSQPTSQA